MLRRVQQRPVSFVPAAVPSDFSLVEGEMVRRERERERERAGRSSQGS